MSGLGLVEFLLWTSKTPGGKRSFSIGRGHVLAHVTIGLLEDGLELREGRLSLSGDKGSADSVVGRVEMHDNHVRGFLIRDVDTDGFELRTSLKNTLNVDFNGL